MFRIGIDLGGTKIEGIVLDGRGREVYRKRLATRQREGYRAIVGQIESLYGVLRRQTGGAPHTFGIGTPGAISPRSGLLKNSNTVCLNGRPFQQDLERALGRKIALQNDANCFAMAEALRGAGRGKDLVFGMILGTGCGGGIVHRGEIITGPQAIAGEWGHMSIDPRGPVCYCGQRGCVECYISGGGVEARYAEAFGRRRSFRRMVEEYQRGEPRARQCMRSFLSHFGRAVANLIAILDPDVIVLGGGVSNFAALYTKGVAEVAGRVFNDCLETPIVKHQLGDSAGVIGAAMIGI